MSFQTPITIYNAIEDVESNKLLLPNIQREFVWSHEQIEWLFDSIMRNYPISSFLFWFVEGDTKNQYKFYNFLKNYREKYQTHNVEFDTNGVNDFMAVLDGQQRLAAIYIGLKGSYAYKLPRLWWENNEYSIPTRNLYLNILEKLEDQEDGRIYDFEFLTKDEYNDEKDKWFRVGDILKYQDIFKFNEFLDNNNYKKNQFSYKTLSYLQKSIHTDRIINYFLEKEQNLDKSLNIFIRINSGGEPLNFSDLIMSIAIANWEKIDAKKEINQLVDEIRDKGFFISKDLILKAFLVLFSSDIKFKVTNFTKTNAKDFEIKWTSIKSAIYNTFELIKSFGFTEKTLTSKNAVIPIIYYLYHMNIYKDFYKKKEHEKDREKIKKWLHIVLVKRIFGGQADNILSKIRTVFTDDITKSKIKDSITSFPYDSIVKELKGTTKDITFDEDYIDKLLLTQKDDSLAFSILAILYPNLDYRNGDFHKDHIFADSFFTRKKLKLLGIQDDKMEFYLNSENYNSILNLQLLDSNENKSKQNNNLKDWVIKESKNKNVTQKEFCERHLFPEIFDINDFPKFIKVRRNELKEILKKLG
jgi:uncharacterized protein with ParB-like and HNH nuclease domain